MVVVQKGATRIINNSNDYDHTDPLLKHNEVLKVDDLYKFTCLFSKKFSYVLFSCIYEVWILIFSRVL